LQQILQALANRILRSYQALKEEYGEDPMAFSVIAELECQRLLDLAAEFARAPTPAIGQATTPDLP
jgi:hypothetical protein